MSSSKLEFVYHNTLEKPNNDQQEFLVKRVEELKLKPQPEQRTQEWFDLRRQMITASDWGAVLGKNKYSSYKEVLKKKIKPPKYVQSEATIWGTKYEEVATKIYERRNNVEVVEFGVIQHEEYSFLGASPDGITNEGIMLEIKCPYRRQITGIPPEYYFCQVQGQLEVCKLDRCDFLECKLVEIEELEEYENMLSVEILKNEKERTEMGIVFVMYNKKTKNNEYIYSDFWITSKEYKKKLKELQSFDFKRRNPNLIFSHTDLWYLDEISCVPIFRDKKWFEEALVILKQFWDEVTYYRNNPDIANNELFSKRPKIKERITEKKDNVINIEDTNLKSTNPDLFSKLNSLSSLKDIKTRNNLNLEENNNENNKETNNKEIDIKDLFTFE
jgi:putative phage-type endonuclease